MSEILKGKFSFQMFILAWLETTGMLQNIRLKNCLLQHLRQRVACCLLQLIWDSFAPAALPVNQRNSWHWASGFLYFSEFWNVFLKLNGWISSWTALRFWCVIAEQLICCESRAATNQTKSIEFPRQFTVSFSDKRGGGGWPTSRNGETHQIITTIMTSITITTTIMTTDQCSAHCPPPNQPLSSPLSSASSY